MGEDGAGFLIKVVSLFSLKETAEEGPGNGRGQGGGSEFAEKGEGRSKGRQSSHVARQNAAAPPTARAPRDRGARRVEGGLGHGLPPPPAGPHAARRPKRVTA